VRLESVFGQVGAPEGAEGAVLALEVDVLEVAGVVVVPDGGVGRVGEGAVVALEDVALGLDRHPEVDAVVQLVADLAKAVQAGGGQVFLVIALVMGLHLQPADRSPVALLAGKLVLGLVLLVVVVVGAVDVAESLGTLAANKLLLGLRSTSPLDHRLDLGVKLPGPNVVGGDLRHVVRGLQVETELDF